MKKDYPVLYVFVRSDMPSLGSSSGKMAAHSGHAANAFVHENVVKKLLKGKKLDPAVQEWMDSTEHGFGTQINLKGAWSEVCDAHDHALKNGFPADLVTDPTYPYVVDGEIVGLIENIRHTLNPVDIGNDKFMCFRAEHTAAYIFGMKSQLVDIVGKFQLHP